MSESIKARFWLTKRQVTVIARFHDVDVTVRWKRDTPTGDVRRHIQTLVSNLDRIIHDGLEEAFVQDEANGLDEELDKLFPRKEEPNE